ncbi:MAG: type VI secretion system protein TssA [Polaromonas sp.]
MANTTITELGKQAIAGPMPAGNEVREDPDFELLESEIAKLSSPVHSSTLDWGKVTQLSADLLSSKGKDLLVACYLTGGLLETRGLPGLADGLRVLADLLETYWDTLYPTLKRMRGRRNALQWLIDRIQQRAAESDWASMAPQPEELLAALVSNLQCIDKVLLDKDSEAPSVRTILVLIKAIPAIDTTPVEAKADAQNTADKSATQASAADTKLESSAQCERSLEAACEQLGHIAEWYLNNDASNPVAYRLDRLAAWTSLNALPPADSGQTKIPPPISQIVEALERLKSSQSDAELVQFAEAQLSTFPFWLDLNCICAQALSRMGADFAAAQAEVCGETARLIARLPGLSELSFDGGMPFADGDTQRWLSTLASSQSKSVGGTSNRSNARESESVLAAIGNARALAASDDLIGAADCLQQQLALNPPTRDQFVLRIRLCEMLLVHRPRALLKGFAQSLLATIDRHDLASWDPALALDGLKVAYDVMSRDDEDKESVNALLTRMAALDAGMAVKLLA